MKNERGECDYHVQQTGQTYCSHTKFIKFELIRNLEVYAKLHDKLNAKKCMLIPCNLKINSLCIYYSLISVQFKGKYVCVAIKMNSKLPC